MKIINEKTSLVLELKFSDELDRPVIPASAQYRLDDVSTGQQIAGWTNIAPSAATYDLVISDEQNAIIDPDQEVEKKRVTVSFTFGSDNKRATDEYTYAVRNLTNIT